MSGAQVWFITGCSRGIGRAIAEAALEAGHQVTATARDPKSLGEMVAAYPENCLGVALDVNNPGQIRDAIGKTNDRFGRIDVLINNAGYGLQGTVEELEAAKIRQQMDTNFFGLVDVTQAVLPTMRNQGNGYIVNVSSIAGMRGMAGFGMYNASKFAVNGMSEALAQEVKPFGIKVSVVEPGPYKTDWAGSSLDRSGVVERDHTQGPYAELNTRQTQGLKLHSGNQPGDPRQIASVLLEAAQAEKPPMHMVFGDPGIETIKKHIARYQDPSFISFFPHDKFNL